MSERPGSPRPDDAHLADARFDEELRRATRALVTEELPRGLLDPAIGASLGLGGGVDGLVRTRRALPGFAATAGAVVVLLLATAVAFAPGAPGGIGPSGSPSLTASPVPTTTPVPTLGRLFRTTAEIRADLETLRYACRDGLPLETIEPGPDAIVRESAVCLPPSDLGPFMGAVIVSESASGQVVEAHGKADFTGVDTRAGRDAIAATLSKAAAVVVAEGSGNAVAQWVSANLVALEPNDGVATTIGGLGLKIGRSSDGGYLMSVHLPIT